MTNLRFVAVYIITLVIILLMLAIMWSCTPGNINRSDSQSHKMYIPDTLVSKAPKDTVG